MFDLLEKLVSNSTEKKKSELIEFLGTLKTPEKISLDLINSDEKFADLKKELESAMDAKVGTARTKWDAEKKKTPEILEIKETETSPEIASILDKFANLEKGLEALTMQKVVSDLKSYTAEKASILPEELRSGIIINENSTTETIDSQINAFKQTFESYQKKVDNTPNQGNFTETGNISDWKDFIETKNETKNE